MKLVKRKILVIGLDCAPPELVFEKFREEMPNFKKLMEGGVYGRLRSCYPPITIPAWMVMATSKSPSKLGVYGFRQRKNNTYGEISIVNSNSIKEKTIWDIVSENQGKVCLVGVPPSYPPKSVNGCLISGFITPDITGDFTYPSSLKEEIRELVGEYIIDVKFRTEEREELLKQIYEMTEKRFQVIEYLIKKKPWDFFMFVEMGPDRIHHAFWRYQDPDHHLYVPGTKFESVIKDYYKYLDEKIGMLLSLIDDNTIVFVVSDHGAKRMKGAFCINEWLRKKGYLKLTQMPSQGTKFEDAQVDWSKTLAWGWGGYYARIFLNMQGREQQGIVRPEDYETLREKLVHETKEIKDENGKPMQTIVIKPESSWKGEPPDLMVFIDDLNYRSAGTIGHDSVFLKENDTGPDDAMHSWDGIFLMYDPRKKIGKEIKGLNLLHFAPTILEAIGLPKPQDMEGRSIL